MKAALYLEDGSLFEGISVGAQGERAGEVVLNTAVVGYQEMMTDPANSGKILVLTYPLIGNYGIADKFNESDKCRLAGLAVKEISRIYSNYQAQGPVEDLISRQRLVTISDIDTRTLAETIRDKGEMRGIISTKDFDKASLAKKLRSSHGLEKISMIKEISVKKLTEIRGRPSGARIGILDLGVTNSLLRQLTGLGCNLTLLPYDTSAEKVLSLKLDGLLISNGPENDESLASISAMVKKLLGKIPIAGISTGHQVIGIACGARLVRMKVGHHGVNYPVKPADSFKGEITVQNHSYVIDDRTLDKKKASVSLRNINDKTIEEIYSSGLKLLGAQYYPASPGFDEPNAFFIRFLRMASSGGKRGRQKTETIDTREVAYAKA